MCLSSMDYVKDSPFQVGLEGVKATRAKMEMLAKSMGLDMAFSDFLRHVRLQTSQVKLLSLYIVL